jgi:hypothetical protein
LPDTAEFNDWQYVAREEYLHKLALILERLAQPNSSERKYERAVQFAWRRTALESCGVGPGADSEPQNFDPYELAEKILLNQVIGS